MSYSIRQQPASYLVSPDFLGSPEISFICAVFYVLAYRFEHFCRSVNMSSVEDLKQKKNQCNESAPQ